MNRPATIVSATAVLLGAAAWSMQARAQDGCDVDFTTEITSQFPNARNACLDIVERDGREYAHFAARIVNVRGNEVQAEFRLPDGGYGRPVSFTPPPDARVRIQGRSYRYRDLSRGQELDVYVPPDRWAFAVHEDPAADFATAPTIVTVALIDTTPQTAAVLPRTASLLPALALAGGLLTALGASLAAVRRRLSASRDAQATRRAL